MHSPRILQALMASRLFTNSFGGLNTLLIFNYVFIHTISLSATVTSVTSIGGRWFSGSDPYMRAIVIGLTSCGSEAPALILRSLFYLWLM